MLRALLSFLILALALTAAPAARADLITSMSSTVTPEAGGLFRYDYTLAVSSASTISASSFAIGVGSDAALILGGSSAPTGFDISYAPGDIEILFTSPDPSFDIAPGATGRFEFESRVGPASTAYQVQGYGSLGTLSTNSGTAFSAAAVPAPASMLLLGVGGLGVMVTTRRLRATPRPA